MITRIIKKYVSVGLVCCGFAAMGSCSDLLESESSRQNIEPSINEKTDSVFYAFGILESLQQLADQYVFQGEMRGDLVKTTFFTDNNLRQLANFSATTENKYDSAYVYYRVINNCNYYIAHADTNLYNGSTNVVINEYAAVKGIRAWAYLQLGRNYERVPFFTEPLTKISQIDKGYPELTLAEIVAQLAPDLEHYSGFKVPTFGPPTAAVSIGTPNWESVTKTFLPRLCFIPVDVILGDMYLETQNFDAAARHYVTYLTQVTNQRTSAYVAPMAAKNSVRNTGIGGGGRPGGNGRQETDEELPDVSNFSSPAVYSEQTNGTWANLFSRNSTDDVITYIPMSTTQQNGPTTILPLTLGFDYYTTPEEGVRSGAPYIDEVQLLPSDAYNLLSDSTEFYYYAGHTDQTDMYDSILISKAGDMRLRSVMHQELEEDSTLQWMTKFNNANIILYRNSIVWLRLAEAFNRLGMPDAAFAILKDGVSELMLQTYADGSYYIEYLTEETRQKLQTTYPLLSAENVAKFETENAYGIHTHGAGKAAGGYPHGNAVGGQTYHTGKSPYQLDRMAGLKMQELSAVYGISIGTTKQDTINAIEDLICDELALESAFEGNRFYDLCRLARHKNQAGLYGGNFGSLWLARKLAFKNPVKDLADPQNWYLPFK
ncbi:MAG: RagB/SusD family nutrient uptake outer membrane protein [Prevotella sp.]|nr:RagB/SusD family nutrient uptake outer membrane protein [Prevotella sp.]